MEQDVVPVERVEQAILLIRGHKVMLDRDLAVLYSVETRVLNQAVKRNRDRFPSDFMLELTRDEIRNRSQSVICSANAKHARKVYAFTEQGVAMLSTYLAPEADRVWSQGASATVHDADGAVEVEGSPETKGYDDMTGDRHERRRAVQDEGK